MSRRILILFFYNFFAFGLAAAPFEFFFFISRGISFQEFAWLQSIYYATMVCLDVPTGVIADRLGRKFVLIAGPIGFAGGFGLCALGDSFAFFALAQVVIGIGHALISGAISSFLFDTLKEHNEEAHFLRYESTATALRLIGTSIAFLSGGIIGKFVSLEWTFWVTTMWTATASLIGLFLREPKVHALKRPSPRQIFVESWKSIAHEKQVRWITIYFAVLFVWLRLSFHTYQAEMKQRGIEDFLQVGIIYFLLNVVAAIFSRSSAAIQRKTGESVLLITMQACLVLSFALLGITQSSWAVLLFFLQQIPFGLHFPVISNYVNHKIPSERRTTVLSFQSMMGRLAFTIFFPVFGWIESHHSLSNALLYSSLLGAVALILLSWRKPR